jgi:hypothetical protein
MSIFSTILEKLGLKKEAPQTATKSKEVPTLSTFTSAPPAKPAAVPMVDVVAKLNDLAAKSKQELDWKLSIVDLMKLLGIDSSYDNRKELATELGCPDNLMKDSASMNTWLHKTVMQKLAENGGNIPRELL